MPANNGEWWATKLARNIERDRETDAHLTSLGWMVVRVWEHEDMTSAAERIMHVVRRATTDVASAGRDN